MTNRTPKALRRWLPAALVVALAAPLAGAQDVEGYGYFRTVEGTIRLTTFEQGEPIEVEPNYPVLTGDRIWVTPGARVEMVLPDRTVARADGSSDLYLESLALSADAQEGAPTVIGLIQGELQLRVYDFFTELEATRIDTDNASIFLQAAGSYRIFGDETGFTEVVVREGFAEVRTDHGSAVVRGGEQAVIEGRDGPRVSLERAASLDGLELWGAELEGTAQPAAYGGGGRDYVDPSLAYAAAPLDRHGTWVEVSGSWAWQPRVYGHWRPYSDGWWVQTPAGLTWVSNEPWGWVTSHYGSWNYWPGYGWLWHPGAVYSPAWVYWYWGPTHVAWVPVGYYSHYYYGRYGSGFGLSFGIYGWAGGSWDYFSYWTFCPVRYFGRRQYHAYWRSGSELSRYGRYRAVPRGVVTADTRPIAPRHWGKPTEVVDALRRESERSSVAKLRGGELPDVTSFVARRPELPDDVRKVVMRGREPGEDAARGRSLVTPSRSKSAQGPSAPWSVARPLPDRGDASPSQIDLPRDAAVMRGSVRRGAPAAPGDSRSIGERYFPADSAGKAGSGPERGSIGGLRAGEEPLQRMLPPSGRYETPSGWRGDSRIEGNESERGSVVRRILDGFRTRTPEAGSSGDRSAPPVSSRPGADKNGTESRPSPSSASPSAPSPRQPSAQPRSSSPPPRSSSAGSGSSSRSSSGSSARSGNSRSGGSKSSAGRSRRKGGGG